ncbi:hypothetical protein TL16_g07187 [Triparma laevis f. inornata]|nr:hypothetical protein TrLO_g4674 [Triparma laevis f. longispina]GMH76767.1 hypothetical protein TL16_g07187 [Triparma laevis f. inornata]
MNKFIALLCLLALLHSTTSSFPPNDVFNNKINGAESRRITFRRSPLGSIIGASKKSETLIKPKTPNSRSLSPPLKNALLFLPRLLPKLLPLLLGRTGLLLRLLKITLPLLLLKHTLTWLYEASGDWYRGRYMRLTYTHLERLYLKHYEAPAVARSFGRTFLQTTILIFSAEIATTVLGDNGIGLGLTGQRGGISKRAMSFAYCSMWLALVVGTGTAFNTAVSTEGESMLSISPVETPHARGIVRFAVDLPQGFYFLRLLRGLDISGGRLWDSSHYTFLDPSYFTRGYIHHSRETLKNQKKGHYLPHIHIPHPWVFPAIWWPLRILQFFSVGKLLLVKEEGGGKIAGHVLGISSSGGVYGWGCECIAFYLAQLALGDEWNRVLFVERR